MIRTILVIAVLAGFGNPLLAQDTSSPIRDILYVTDQLRLSLYQQPSDQSQSVKLLSSGDKLEVEEISGAYALVTTEDGRRGWVKRGFLVATPTASLLLEIEKEKGKSLIAEIDKLGNSKVVIDQYEKDLDAMAKKMEAQRAENEKALETMAGLKQELENKQAEIEAKTEDSPPALRVLWQTAVDYWKFIIPIIVVLMLLTFIISKVIVETRIRNKFHGIKIW